MNNPSRIQKYQENEEIRERARNWRYEIPEEDQFINVFSTKSSRIKFKKPKTKKEGLEWDADGNLIKPKSKSIEKSLDPIKEKETFEQKPKTRSYSEQYSASLRLSSVRKPVIDQTPKPPPQHYISEFDSFLERQKKCETRRHSVQKAQTPQYKYTSKVSEKISRKKNFRPLSERTIEPKKSDLDDSQNQLNKSHLNVKSRRVKKSSETSIFERDQKKQEEIKEKIAEQREQQDNLIFKSPTNSYKPSLDSNKETVASQRKKIQLKAKEMSPILTQHEEQYVKPKKYPVPDFVEALHQIIKIERSESNLDKKI